MNRANLLALADLIERSDRFDLNYYVTDGRLSALHRRRVLREITAAEYDVQANELRRTIGYPVGVATELIDDPDCGSVGCVCGWENARIGHPTASDWELAAASLGLTETQASELFNPNEDFADFPSCWGDDPYLATASRAAKLLRDLAAGTVTFECDRQAVTA